MSIEPNELLARLRGMTSAPAPAQLDWVAALNSTRDQSAPPRVDDVTRIVELPSVDYHTRRDLTDLLRLPGGTMKLRPIQSAALHAVRDAQGALLPIGVGHGKTLANMLAATVLSIPADVWREYTGLVVPACAPITRVLYMTAAGAVTQARQNVLELSAHWRLPGSITVRSYSELSQPKSSAALLEWIGHPANQTLVVLDEAHKLKRPEAARTKRFLRAHAKLDGVRYIVASGTLLSRTLRDGATLAAVALGARTPLPINNTVLRGWCSWLDDTAEAPDPSAWGVIRPLVTAFAPPPAHRTMRETARLAFQARFRSAPGVVASTDGALGVSLQIRTLRSPELPSAVLEQLAVVEAGGSPDGDEVYEDELAEARARRQLACGFWYRWEWGPDGPDEPWLDARREWHRQLRAELRTNSREHYDSPMLVGAELARRDARGADTSELGRARRAWLVERERRPQPPPTVAVWVSDFLMRDAAEWLRGRNGALLWYESRAIADKLEDLGVEVVRAGQDVPHGTDRPLALSVRSHGTGLNLQRWSSSRTIECPPSATVWEQKIGRLHRPGQTAEEVVEEVYTHCETMRDAWNRARSGARMIEQTTGNAQKLCYADIATR